MPCSILALLDGDRFEGRFRDGVHATDVSDLMRRMVKENLLKFDATPLFLGVDDFVEIEDICERMTAFLPRLKHMVRALDTIRWQAANVVRQFS